MPTKLHPPVAEAQHEQPAEGDTRPNASSAANGPPLHQQVEALLLTADRAVSTTRLAGTIDAAGKSVEAAIEDLNAQYESSGRVMRITRVAGGWRLQTTPDMATVLHEAAARRTQHKLSQAALETLSVIAYRQPVMRAEIEAIRGVACGEVLRGLMERRLIRIAGRAEELGRPMLYGTTPDFLRVFGLGSIDDLPDVEGLPRARSVVPDTLAADEDGDDAQVPDDEQVPGDASAPDTATASE